MTALIADRAVVQELPAPIVPSDLNFPVAASVKIYDGAIVVLDASGNAKPAVTGTGLTCVGKALQDADNSNAAAGTISVDVRQGVFWFTNSGSDPVASTATGTLCYLVDDATVAATSNGATRSVAGTVYGVDSTKGVAVHMQLLAPIDASALTTFETQLANTTTGQGAALVGINDAGAVITATNVEAALQEIAKEARSALGDFSGIPVLALTALSNTGVIAGTFVAGASGKIGKLDGMVLTPVTTTGKAVTLTMQIGATTVGGGSLVLNSTNCATLGARIAGATVTSANAFNPTDVITVQCSGVTAFVEGAVLLQVFLASA